MLITPDGEKLSGLVAITLLEEIDEIYQFQIIQKNKNKIVVKACLMPEFRENIMIQSKIQQEIKELFSTHFHADMQIDLEIATEILPNPVSGKLSIVIGCD